MRFMGICAAPAIRFRDNRPSHRLARLRTERDPSGALRHWTLELLIAVPVSRTDRRARIHQPGGELPSAEIARSCVSEDLSGFFVDSWIAAWRGEI